MRIPFAILLLAFAALATAATQPYDESADAKSAIRAAQAEAQRTKVPVLVVFGANWCGDCKALDLALKEGSSAPLIAKNFKVVKVDVGRNDRNTDIAEAYGVPLNSGIPAVAVLSEQGKVVCVTRAGELSGAVAVGDRGIYKFFANVVAQRR